MSLTIDKTINVPDPDATRQSRLRFAAIFNVKWDAFTGEAKISVGFWERPADAAALETPVVVRSRKFQNVRTAAELDSLHDRINERLDELLG